MATYTPPAEPWVDLPDQSTPITAAELTRIESNTERAARVNAFGVTFAEEFGWSSTASALTNDAAIAAAIAAARQPGAGRRVYIGATTEAAPFLISVPIDAKAKPGDAVSIELFGGGRSVGVIQQTTPAADVLQIGGYSAYVHDLTLRHSEAAFSATPTGLGAAISMHKLAYGSVARVQMTANGRGIYLADTDNFEPGTTAGVGNYFHSVSFTDCFILRYGICGIQIANDGDVSTGSSFRGVWIQNRSTSGEQIQPSVRALDLFLCDEMTFTQLNIEDFIGNTAVLLNSCGAIMFESLHFERAHLAGPEPQYFRVAGGSQLVVDGVTFAFSDLARAGSTGVSHLFTAVTGGRIDVRGVTCKNLDNTAGIVASVVDLSDATAGSTAEVTNPSGGDADELVMTVTPASNPGILRAGDRYRPGALPRVAAPPVPITYAAALTPDGRDGNYRTTTATGNPTLNPPTNPEDGQLWRLRVTASGAQRVVTLAAGLRRPSSIPATLTIPSGRRGDIGLVYDQSDGATWSVLFAQAV